jgi:hypothetical protein
LTVKQEQHDAAIAVKQSRIDELQSDKQALQDSHAETIAQKNARIDALQTEIADIHTLLGETPNLQRLKRQRERVQRQAEIAAAQRRLAELEAEENGQ